MAGLRILQHLPSLVGEPLDLTGRWSSGRCLRNL